MYTISMMKKILEALYAMFKSGGFTPDDIILTLDTEGLGDYFAEITSFCGVILPRSDDGLIHLCDVVGALAPITDDDTLEPARYTVSCDRESHPVTNVVGLIKTNSRGFTYAEVIIK